MFGIDKLIKNATHIFYNNMKGGTNTGVLITVEEPEKRVFDINTLDLLKADIEGFPDDITSYPAEGHNYSMTEDDMFQTVIMSNYKVYRLTLTFREGTVIYPVADGSSFKDASIMELNLVEVADTQDKVAFQASYVFTIENDNLSVWNVDKMNGVFC